VHDVNSPDDAPFAFQTAPAVGRRISVAGVHGGSIGQLSIAAACFFASLASCGALTPGPVEFLKTCRPPGLKREALCGKLLVRENRTARRGRRIPLNIIVLPATGPSREPDPVFYIVGGPGQAATESAERAAAEQEQINASLDVVLVDQRGTGGSNPLRCRFYPDRDLRQYLGPPPSPEQVRKCRAELEKRADLTAYTTPEAVADLEQVRRALGYPRINLDAGSYGTRVALVYMRGHPEAIRTAALRGLSPTNFRVPLPFARAGQAVLDRLFEDCQVDPACHSAYPDPRGDLAAVLERLRLGPVSVEVENPVTRRRDEARISRDLFVSRLHLLLFSTGLSSRVPDLLHRGASGNFEPFAQLAVAFGKAITDQIYFGMQLSVVCSEDSPFISPADVARETSGTFLGAVRVSQLSAFCSDWPRGRLPEGYIEPVRASTPTLLISGALDPATPKPFADEVAAALAKAVSVIVPYGGHINADPCLDSIAAQFIADGSAEGLDLSCVEEIRRPPFIVPEDRPGS
jgi:pimeloyl-ACP methyl ester carboxylesterase